MERIPEVISVEAEDEEMLLETNNVDTGGTNIPVFILQES